MNGTSSVSRGQGIRDIIAFTLIGLLLTPIWSAAAEQPSDSSHDRLTSPSVRKSCMNDPVELTINRWTQGEGPWCWATTAAIVMAYRGTVNAPCFVVNAVLRDKGELLDGIDCCKKEDRDNYENGCLKSGTASDAFRSFEFAYDYRSVDESTNPMTFKQVTEELCDDRPFISKLKGKASTFAHTTVVYGSIIDPSGTEQVYVHDPQDDNPKPWIVPYDEFFRSSPYYVHIGDYLLICDRNQGNCPIR
jgi:hypothetical protein